MGNACERLVSRGEAVRVSSSPRTYRATSATAAAAQFPGAAPAPARAARRAAKAATSPTPAPVPAPSPAPATGPGAPGRKHGRPLPFRRPNGQTYHARELAQLPDVEALRRLRQAGVPLLLYGPPGTGKTSLIEAAFPDLITVAGDGDTTVGDLVGEYTQDEAGGFRFVYGPLVTAMQEGRALFLDEATLISPSVLAALYPAMDGRRQVQVKAHQGETIKAADGFYVIAGHNPGVHGAVLTKALSSRFSVQIQVGSDYDLAAALGIHPAAVRIARNLAKVQEAGEVGWAPQLRELLAFRKVADVLGVEAAFANLVGVAPVEDRDTIAEIVSRAAGRAVSALALGARL